MKMMKQSIQYSSKQLKKHMKKSILTFKLLRKIYATWSQRQLRCISYTSCKTTLTISYCWILLIYLMMNTLVLWENYLNKHMFRNLIYITVFQANLFALTADMKSKQSDLSKNYKAYKEALQIIRM